MGVGSVAVDDKRRDCDMATATDNISGRAAVITPHLIYDHHAAKLAASGLTLETCKAAGIYSESNIVALKVMLSRKDITQRWGPGLVFPYHDARGQVVFSRVAFDNPPKDHRGRPKKYLHETGAPARPYFPPGVRESLAHPQQEVIITEGEKKALAGTQEVAPTIGLPGVDCWHHKQSTRPTTELGAISWPGRPAYVIFDSDAADNEDVERNAQLLAAALQNEGAVVKIVRLPSGPDGEKWGLDDFLVHRGPAELRKLMEFAEAPSTVDSALYRLNAKTLDPSQEAARFLETSMVDDVLSVRFWKGGFLKWRQGAYTEIPCSEVRGKLVRHLNQSYSMLTTAITNNVVDQVKAQSCLGFRHSPPCWIGEPPETARISGELWKPEDVLVSQNGMVHLPTLAAGGTSFWSPLTPRFFTTSALDYEFSLDASEPATWLSFLNQLWPDDQQSIDTLQEWFGYSLTPDTSQQKIVMLIGPKRSGKGTIARVIRALIGPANVAGPTLAGLATNFGLWPLLGKSLAIISDARLSGRTDQTAVVERLLTISGEDSLTVDRKNMEPITTKLPTRLVLISNELPRLGDSSGALIGRMILLRLTKSFYGHEDPTLTDKILAELSGILLWAIEGWRRLRERGRFSQPDSALDLLGDLSDLSSPISAFVRERCVVGPGYQVPVGDLFSEWQTWCVEKGRKEHGTEQTFGRDLAAAFPDIRRVRPRDGASRYRAYEGIGLVLS